MEPSEPIAPAKSIAELEGRVRAAFNTLESRDFRRDRRLDALEADLADLLDRVAMLEAIAIG